MNDLAQMLTTAFSQEHETGKKELLTIEPSNAAVQLRSLVGEITGYEERGQQLEMVALVETALKRGQHGLIEAATGTGKGIGYGTPVVLSNKKTIISTSNKALQTQLMQKDMPWIARYIRPFSFALMKGEGNYLCLDRLEKFGQEEAGDTVEDGTYHRLQQLCETDSFDGDFENKALSFVPVAMKGKVNRDRGLCAGSKCDFYEQCYYYQMRREAEAAQVVITNHSLLAIDAAKGGKVLPEHEQVVLDESHHLEDAATEAFTVKIAASRITSLLSLKTLRANTKEKKRDAIERQARITWQELERRYEEGARGNNNRVALPSPVEEGLQLATLLQKLAKELEDNKPGNLAHQPKEDKLYDKLVQRVRNLASDVRQVFSVEEGDYVHCMEYVGDAGKASIEVSRIPLNVAPLLQQSLFDRCPVICTSATLATGNGNASFSYFKSRVGIERAIERVLPTVFDYQQNALLYVPRDLPSPNYETHRDAYEQAVIVRMLQLVHISQGRAFLLFNSRRMLERAYACFLTADMEYPLLAQLEGVSRDGLIQQFRENGNAVLFGLKSFWEGVDVQGEALSLVVIDKLPFSVPGDPVREARRELLDSPFKTYDLPQVILQLKQGVGRLIRSHEDRGCMAILDTRIHTRWDEWGKDICKALPPAVKTSRLQDVERFFN